MSTSKSLAFTMLVWFTKLCDSLFKLCSMLQASQVYQTMTIESLSKMIPFFDFSVVEKISVDALKHKFLTMKIDHMNGAVSFSNLVSFVI